MNYLRAIYFFPVVAMLIFSTAEAASTSVRTKKRWGFYLTQAGDPFPNLVGFNLSFNLRAWLQLHAGGGLVVTSSPTTYSAGAGARFLLPNLNCSPFIGFGYSQLFSTVDRDIEVKTPLGTEFNTTSNKGQLYVSGGLQWTTTGGFVLGAGVNYSLVSGSGWLPFGQLGYQFGSK